MKQLGRRVSRIMSASLLAFVLAACGHEGTVDGENMDDPGSTTPAIDAAATEPTPSEAGAGGSGGGSLPLPEASRDATNAIRDASDAASNATGPQRWTGTPFVMDTWFWSSNIAVAQRVDAVQQLGYQGLALSTGHEVAEYLTAMRAKGLHMPGIWTAVDASAYPTGLVQSIAGTGGWIWLSLQSAANDDAALSLVNKLADECRAAGLPGVALYPHVGFWMQRVGDAVRLAKAAARPEVGVVFNQYHWMAVEGGRDLAATLQSALPYLKDVTINGSDAAPSILPLGKGTYDVAAILRAVASLDFHGSVGLQGYSISGDIPGQLASAKQAWDKMIAALPRDGG
jgi:sugar phosphate isomerase/epimerase